MNAKLIIGLAVLCVVGAFFAGREFPSTPAESDELTAGTASATDGEEAAPLLDARQQAIAKLEDSLEAARQANEKLAADNAELAKQLEASETGAKASAVAAGGGTAYVPDEFKDVVSGMTWPEAGEAAFKMVPLLEQLAQDFGVGKSPTQEVGIQIFKWNQKLQTLAVTAIGAEVPGAGGNGAFTHPVVTLNLMQAALSEAGVPLHESQLKDLRAAGDRFMEADARRKAGYNEETLELQKTFDECGLKDRMFAEIHATLTGKQSAVLHPESIRGRMGIDIYSSGTIWYAVSQPVDFTTREDLAAGLVQRYLAQSKLTEDDVTLLKNAAKDWADSFSQQFLDASADPIAQASRKGAANGALAGWQKVSQATEAAAHQLALNRILIDRVGGDAAKVRMIRGDGRVFIPIKRP